MENPDSDTSRGRGCGRQGRSVVAGGQAAGRPLRGTVCRLPAKLNVPVLHDPVIPLPGAPTGAESCRLHGDPHTDVSRSRTHSCSESEAAEMFFRVDG